MNRSRHIHVGDTGRARFGYAILVGLVLVIAVAGYVGYVIYPRFEAPAVQGAGLMALASTAGVASFFSPCSFPLLLVLLGRRAGGDSTIEDAPRPAVFGGALALGAMLFMVLFGVAIGFGGEVLFSEVTFTSGPGIVIRSTIGILLIALGLIQTGVVPLSMHRVSRLVQPLLVGLPRLRRERPILGHVVFGFAYVLAGFG